MKMSVRSTFEIPGLIQHTLGARMKPGVMQGHDTWRASTIATEVVGHNVHMSDRMSRTGGLRETLARTSLSSTGCDCQHEVDYKVPGMICGCNGIAETAMPSTVCRCHCWELWIPKKWDKAWKDMGGVREGGGARRDKDGKPMRGWKRGVLYDVSVTISRRDCTVELVQCTFGLAEVIDVPFGESPNNDQPPPTFLINCPGDCEIIKRGLDCFCCGSMVQRIENGEPTAGHAAKDFLDYEKGRRVYKLPDRKP